MEIKIQDLMDEARCYDTLRELRWPEGRYCPHCDSKSTVRQGFNETHTARQRYLCKSCNKRFDDLTHTVFSGHRQPLKVWMLALYFMGLNLSNDQIAKELDLNRSDVHRMTTVLREGIWQKKTTDS